MGGAKKIHPECLRIADVHKTVNCSLARIMRKECRKRGIRHLRVLYSCEEPVRIAAAPGAARSERTDLGTASFMPPIMGQMIAGEVLRHISGLGEGDDVLRRTRHARCGAKRAAGGQAGRARMSENMRKKEGAGRRGHEGAIHPEAPGVEMAASNASTETPGFEHRWRLFDMHCHLDRMANADEVAREAVANDMALFCTTVTPADALAARSRFGTPPNVRVGVGLHPWWITDGRCGEIEIEQARATRSRQPLHWRGGARFRSPPRRKRPKTTGCP